MACPQGGLGPSPEEERKIWVDKVLSEIRDKSESLARAEFCHGDQDWLVLWDCLGTPDSETSVRGEAISARLASLWRPEWFSRVILQSHDFSWQLMFARNLTTFCRLR